MDKIFEALKTGLPGIQKNVLLKDHTTFDIGGPAEYFFIAKKKGEVLEAVTLAKKLKLPIFIFGGGSNLLVSDDGIRGLVVKIEIKDGIRLKNNALEAPAGATMKELVDFSISHAMGGLEWAGGLPGTFGGAIRGNAGCFGAEIKDAIVNVEALGNNLTLLKLTNRQCQFTYRSSVFKKKNWIVLSASVKLKKGDKENLKGTSNSHINYRKEKHPLEYPNAGSIFKNVDFKKIPRKFQALFSDKVKKDPFPIVPAAWFIIGAGLAGKKIGQAEISQKHSNYIVNLGGAKAKDVLQLIQAVKKNIKEKYEIDLEQEIQYLE